MSIKNCMAKTNSGKQCKMSPTYPEEYSIVCGMHKKNYKQIVDETMSQNNIASEREALKHIHEQYSDESVEQETKKEPQKEQEKVEVDGDPTAGFHVFASIHANHNVHVNFEPAHDEDGNRRYFKVRFSNGAWQTKDDEKAQLLMKAVENSDTLKNKITKVQ